MYLFHPFFVSTFSGEDHLPDFGEGQGVGFVCHIKMDVSPCKKGRHPEREPEPAVQAGLLSGKKLGKGFDNLRVEACAGAVVDFCQRVWVRDRRLVNTTVNHGDIGIHDGDDARPKGDTRFL